jgi:hypothetical protein
MCSNQNCVSFFAHPKDDARRTCDDVENALKIPRMRAVLFDSCTLEDVYMSTVRKTPTEATCRQKT